MNDLTVQMCWNKTHLTDPLAPFQTTPHKASNHRGSHLFGLAWAAHLFVLTTADRTNGKNTKTGPTTATTMSMKYHIYKKFSVTKQILKKIRGFSKSDRSTAYSSEDLYLSLYFKEDYNSPLFATNQSLRKMYL